MKVSVALLSGVLFLAAATPLSESEVQATAAVCNTNICVGNSSSCTISGTHLIEDYCDLDFENKNVTLASGAQLIGEVPGVWFSIEARNLTVEGGTIASPEGEIDITTVGRTKILNTPGRRGQILSRDGGTVLIQAHGGFVLEGDIDVTSSATSPYLTGGIDIITNGGPISITSTAKIHADTDGGNTAGTITINGEGSGPPSSNEIMQIDGLLTADGVNQADGGEITLKTSQEGFIIIGSTATLQALSDHSSQVNGNITIGPACGLKLQGTVDALGRNRSNTGKGGMIDIAYRKDFILSGKVLTSVDDGINWLTCRGEEDTCEIPYRIAGNTSEYSPAPELYLDASLDSCTGFNDAVPPTEEPPPTEYVPPPPYEWDPLRGDQCHSDNECYVSFNDDNDCTYSRCQFNPAKGVNLCVNKNFAGDQLWKENGDCNIRNLQRVFGKDPKTICSAGCRRSLNRDLKILKTAYKSALRKPKTLREQIENDYLCNKKSFSKINRTAKKLDRWIAKHAGKIQDSTREGRIRYELNDMLTRMGALQERFCPKTKNAPVMKQSRVGRFARP